MRHTTSLVALASLLALAGCQAGTPSTPAPRKAPVAAAGAVARALPRTLVAAKDAVAVKGSLVLDAHYVTSKAGGSILAGPEGRIALPEGGSLNGSVLVSSDGGSVIAQGAGNIIAPDDAGIVSNDGGSVLSHDGGSVISNDGGSMISHDGSSVIATGGGNAVTHRSVLAADDDAIGTQLPAAGMVIQVRTLHGGQRVPVGVDADGKPAYAVYSDLAGKFTLYLPKGLAENVRIYATPAAKTDPRLRYAVLGMTSGDVTINEDTSLATTYVRQALKGRLEGMMLASADTVATSTPVFGADLDALLNAAAREGQVDKLDDKARGRLADQVIDDLLAPVDLAAATFTDANDQTYPCLGTATQIMAVTRGNVAALMQAKAADGVDPTAWFAAQSFMPAGYPIEKPSDFVQMLVDSQLTKLSDNELVRFQHIHDIVVAAHLDTNADRMQQLLLASDGITKAVAAALAKNEAAAAAALSDLRTRGN